MKDNYIIKRPPCQELVQKGYLTAAAWYNGDELHMQEVTEPVPENLREI